MNESDKIKVVWLCHFSNEEVRQLYPRKTKRPLYKFARKILGLHKKEEFGVDFAAWITAGIEEVRKHDDLELHIVSPQTDMKGLCCEFESHGVYYHFYNPNWTLLMMNLVKNLNLWLKLQNSSCFAKRFIKKIKPDIVDLIGVENIYHSCAILYLDEAIPKMITLQTFYSNPDTLQLRPYKINSLNWKLERKLLPQYHYFNLTSLQYKKLLLEINPNAVTFSFSFMAIKLPQIEEVEKEYDFINFASGLGKPKGPLDTLHALAIVKKQYPNVRLNFSGKIEGTGVEKKDYDELIEKYGLQDNVSFTSYHETQRDLFRHIKKARFAVLPIYFDIVPGTLIQAMYYELPAVTYATYGTPNINKDDERILIAERGNVEQLAEKMLILLDNPQTAEVLKKKAKEWADIRFDNTRLYYRLLEGYKAVIAHEKLGNPIPERLLLK